jgi:RNA polymerase sigma-70 factor (ECF subfamily)
MPTNDAILLERWNARHDAEAFSELVSRYADQVYATCMRILRNETDAEDVAQECFLRLAQASDEIRTSVGGWLHRVATTKSLERIRAEGRRRIRDRAFQETQATEPLVGWSDIHEHVDAAIDTLPDDLQLVLVAHFLERKTHAEVAREFGVHRRTVSYRIQRGLDAVREYLSARGVTLSAVALGSLCTAHVSAAAPLTLKASLGKLAIAAGATPGSSGTAAAWSTGGMMLMKGKTIGIGLLVALLVVGGLLWRVDQSERSKPDPSQSVPVASNDRDDTTELGAVTTPPAKPTPPPAADASGAQIPEPAPALDTESDSVAPESGSLSTASFDWDVAARKEGYEPIANEQEYASIDGTVVDIDGYPVEGAQILVSPGSRNGEIASSRLFNGTADTGSDGGYRIEGIRYSGKYWVNATKPGYADTFQGKADGIPLTIAAGDALTGVNIMLESGTTLRGRVLSRRDEPVTDAVVQLKNAATSRSQNLAEYQTAQTDNEGYFSMGFDRWTYVTFRVRSVLHGTGTFPGVRIQADEVVELHLEEPATIYGTARNKNGTPIANGYVAFFGSKSVLMTDDEGSHENGLFAASFNSQLDENGTYEIDVDPGLDYGADLGSSTGVELKDRERLFDLKAGERREWSPVATAGSIFVRGVVIGEPSGKPFGVRRGGGITVYANQDGGSFGASRANVASDGTFDISILNGPGTYTFRARHFFFEDRMAGESSEPYDLEDGDEIEIQLNVPESQWFSVQAVDAGGEPLEGASVSFLSDEYGSYNPHLVTNADGRMDEPIPLAPYAGLRLRVEAAGYATAIGAHRSEAEPGTVHPEETLVLWPGAGFEGDLRGADGAPIVNSSIALTLRNSAGQEWVFESDTSAEGHFTIVDQAPADIVSITLRAGDAGEWSNPSVPLEAAAITNLGVIHLKE